MSDLGFEIVSRQKPLGEAMEVRMENIKAF
jgi:hypothetical protein